MKEVGNLKEEEDIFSSKHNLTPPASLKFQSGSRSGMRYPEPHSLILFLHFSSSMQLLLIKNETYFECKYRHDVECYEKYSRNLIDHYYQFALCYLQLE